MREMYYYLHKVPVLNRCLKKGNPIMEVKVNGQRMKLPFNHMGPIYQDSFKNYDRQIGEICKIILKKLKKINVVDIGANIGDTIINIGVKEGRYLAIEGETEFFSLLKENTKNYDVSYENVFLSDSEKSGYRNIITAGTGALVEDDNSEVSIVTLDRLMEEKYSSFKADIIKIDTDGFDFKVIRGGRNYIRNTKPVIFFEWDKGFLNAQREDELSIFQELSDMGYKDIILFDNFGNRMLSINTADIKILEYMINYTMNKDKRIFYYDVLAVHEDSPFAIRDFECL